MSDIFKKITSIENDDMTPDDGQAVKALKLRPASAPNPQGPIDDDPVPGVHYARNTLCPTAN